MNANDEAKNWRADTATPRQSQPKFNKLITFHFTTSRPLVFSLCYGALFRLLIRKYFVEIY